MKQRGITLLELVICIGIVVIMASSAMLILGHSLQKQELESASLLLASDLRWLQQLSMNGGSSAACILQFNQSEPVGYYITDNTQVIKKTFFPRGIRLYVSHSFITFGLSGAPLTGAQTISLQSDKLNLWKYVVLAPVTGRVRISDTLPRQWED